MSRIEEALKNAFLLRSINGKHEKAVEPQGPQMPESGINVLIISRDLHISKLINNLQSFLQAEIITSDDIVLGMKSFFEKRPIEIDDYELKFTALMLDNLCCYCSGATSNQDTRSDVLHVAPVVPGHPLF